MFFVHGRPSHLLLHDLVQPQEGSSGGTSQAIISSLELEIGSYG